MDAEGKGLARRGPRYISPGPAIKVVFTPAVGSCLTVQIRFASVLLNSAKPVSVRLFLPRFDGMPRSMRRRKLS
jgi:hypothetical protein